MQLPRDFLRTRYVLIPGTSFLLEDFYLTIRNNRKLESELCSCFAFDILVNEFTIRFIHVTWILAHFEEGLGFLFD